MEAADGVASAAVQILTAFASGAATAVGGGTGQALSDLIRRRLSSEEGRAALAGFDADPTDLAVTQELRDVIGEALTADLEFERALTRLLSNPSATPSAYTNSVVIGSGKVRNSQISLGPLSISNTRNNRNSLTVVAVVLLAVLALALYGGVHLITGRSPGNTESAPKPTRTQTKHVVTPEDLVSKILPDRDALPPGWEVSGGPHLNGYLACFGCVSEADRRNAGNVFWSLPGSQNANFFVDAYTSSASAEANYAKASKSGEVIQMKPGAYFSDSYIAKEDRKVISMEEGGSPVVVAFIRIETVLITIQMNSDWKNQEGNLTAFAYMMSERAKQALDGQPVRSVVPQLS
ncbi:hypothetical protein ACWGGS_01930 [Streptomyces decoyicus]